MTPTAVETLARQMYNAVSDTAFFSQAEIFSYMTDACMEIARECNGIPKFDSSTTSTSGTRIYSTPSDCIKVRRVEYAGSKLEPITFREDDSLTLSDSTTTDTGTPQYYFVWGSSIYVRPTPDTSADGIAFYYYGMPTAVTAVSTLEVPAEYHYDLTKYICHRMALKDEDPATADRYYNQWRDAVGKAVINEKMKSKKDSYTAVQDVESLPTTVIGSV